MPRPFNILEFNEEWLDRLNEADPYNPKDIEDVDPSLRKRILEMTDGGHNFTKFNIDPASKQAGEFLDAYTQEYFPAIEEAARKAGRLSAAEEAEKFARMTGLDSDLSSDERLRAHDTYSHIRPYEAGLSPDYRENVVIKTNALPPKNFKERIKDLVGINRDSLNKRFFVPNNPVTPFNENFAILNDTVVGSHIGIHRQPEYVKRFARENIIDAMELTGTSQTLERDIFNKLRLKKAWDDADANQGVLDQSMDENYITGNNRGRVIDYNPTPNFLDKLKKQYSQISELLNDKYIEPANKEIMKVNALMTGTPALDEGGDEMSLLTHDKRTRFNRIMNEIEDAQNRSHRVGLRKTTPSSYVGENIPGRTFLNAVPPAAAAALGPIGDIVDIATGAAAAQDKSKNPIQRAAGVVNANAGAAGLAAIAGGVHPVVPIGLAVTGATMEVLSDPEKRNPMLKFMRSRGPLIMPNF